MQNTDKINPLFVACILQDMTGKRMNFKDTIMVKKAYLLQKSMCIAI